MKIEEVVKKITRTDLNIVSVVGAGISKASGMPTFRGDDGLWNQYRAEDLATPFAFNRDPKLVWEWYRARMRILLEAKPNPAHNALTKLEKAGFSSGIITQNVDGLHEIAGSNKIIEVHGRIRYTRCISCNHMERWDIEDKAKKDLEPPICPRCNDNLLRPDVVWFSEQLDSEKWEKAIELTLSANVMLVIGTSGVVAPVSMLPKLALRNKSIVIEFNIEETPITNFSDYSIFGPCEITLPKFSEELIKQTKRLQDEC